MHCSQCNYGIIYNEFGFLEGLPGQGKLYFDNLRDWNRWQNVYLKDFISKKIMREESGFIIEDSLVDILEGSFRKPFKLLGQGSLCLGKEGLDYFLLEGKKYRFELKQITGLNVQFHAVLEFNYKQNIYRFKFHDKHISAYKWVQAIHFAKEAV